MCNKNFNILSLDGGGSKGVYTLGILKELEQKIGKNLYEHFDLIFGTSTGAIITALLGLGYNVASIQDLYLDLVPKIMSGISRKNKSYRLKISADKIFESKKFDSFKTGIGIVALNFDEQKPLVFKSQLNQVHGMKHSFIPGFGCTISDAVQASCSAYPIFDGKIVETTNQGRINVIDGGFIANNPTLFALIDAHKAYNISEKDIRVLSVGVGRFVEKPVNWMYKFLSKINMVKFVERIISANTTTGEVLSKLLFPNLNILRINSTFSEPEYGTNLIEKDLEKLNKLIQLGRNSFANFEKDIENLFELKST